MGRLIDEKTAIQRFIQETKDSGKDVIHINTIKRLLQDVDTAYDVENVVAELEEKIDISEHNMKNFDNPAYHLYYAMATSTKEAFSEAMKIVKAGGVDGKE